MIIARRSSYFTVAPQSSYLVGQVECEGFPFKTPDNIIAVDTETTGLDPWGKMGVDREVWPARAFMFTLGNTDGETAMVRWQVDRRTREVIKDQRTFDILQKYLGDEKIAKVFYNTNYDYRMLRLAGFTIRGQIYDALLGMKVINPDELNYGLKFITSRLGINNVDEQELSKAVLRARNKVRQARRRIDKGTATEADRIEAATCLAPDGEADKWLAEANVCSRYGRLDAYRTIVLHLHQVDEFDEDAKIGGKKWDVYKRELQLLHVVRGMEDKGVRIDRDRNKEICQFYRDYISKARSMINLCGGLGLNPKSPKQMTKLFFGTRGYQPLKYSKKKRAEHPIKCQHCKGDGCKICQHTGWNPKCDGDFLEHIGIAKDDDDNILPKDKLAYWMLHYSAAKTMSGFVDQYDELIHQESKDVWIIHPNYKQAEAITGRFSCAKPNLQNVASDDSGKKRSNVPYRPRECFIPRPGCVLYLPDYSQIEVWLLALLSGDQDFIGALARGGDAHQNVAKVIWGDHWDYDLAKASEIKDPSSLTDAERKNLKLHKYYRKLAKNLQFCIVYGGGIKKIASMSGLTIPEAEKFKADYDERLPAVAEMMNKTIRIAKQKGYITNPYGREYPINPQFAYVATNYLVQGTAADLIKNAMIRVDGICKNKHRDKMDLLLTIHDELMIENKLTNHNMEAMKDVVTAMQGDWKFLKSPVPFPVGMKIATERWSKTQEIKLAA